MKFIKNILMVVLMGMSSVCHADGDKKMVGVFCSADDKIDSIYKGQIFVLGRHLALAGFSLMTGGSNTGLMKEVANGFLEKGLASDFHGIVPEIMKAWKVAHPSLSEEAITWTNTVHDRLQHFHKRCDAIIVAPGGAGTLHELLDFIVHMQFNLIAKRPIILLNINGYWDGLVLLLNKMVESNALNPEHVKLITVIDSVYQSTEMLNKLFVANERQKVNNQVLDPALGRYWEKEKNN